MSAPQEPKRPVKEAVTRIAARAGEAASRAKPRPKVKWGLYASSLTFFLIELVKGWGVDVPAGAEGALTPLVGFALAWWVREHEEDTFIFEPDWDEDDVAF